MIILAHSNMLFTVRRGMFVPSPFCCGEQFTVNPALSINGFIALDIIEGSMNAAHFHNFIVLKVVSLALHSSLSNHVSDCRIKIDKESSCRECIIHVDQSTSCHVGVLEL